MSTMMKSRINYVHLMKQYYSSGKWNIPRELLSNAASKSVTQNNLPRSMAMERLLRKKFPKAEDIRVKDLSGNCGFMYEVLVVSEEFAGLPLVKQHMLVTDVLSKDIRNMHGITIETKVPGNTKKPPS